MFPVIWMSHSLRLSTWGVMVFLAALAVLWLGRINAPARGMPPELIERSWPWLFLGGFLGAHFYYLIVVDGWPLRHLPLRNIVNIFSGTAVQGGIIGGVCAAAVYLRWEGYPFLPFCDALSPAGALAQAIARIGCFAAGCCYGRKTTFFLGVVFSSPFTDPPTPRGVPLHPAQLYEAFLDLGLAVFLQKRLKAPGRQGTLFALYLMGAGLIRFVVQFFRDDDRGHLTFGLAHSHFLSMVLFIAAAVLYHKKSKEVAP